MNPNAPTSPPADRPWTRQRWRDLLFLHAAGDPDRLQALLPPGLALDTFNGSPYLSFVPFVLASVQFPGLRWPSFPETNVRTYVTHPVHGPGVWFFSLDASSYLACLGARCLFKLPYMHCAMVVTRNQNEIGYYGTRVHRQRLPSVWPKTAPLESYTVRATPALETRPAAPGSLDHFLLERYRLYSADRSGRLMTATIRHDPYRFSDVSVSELRLSGLEGLAGPAPFAASHFVDEVWVDAYRPVRVLGG